MAMQPSGTVTFLFTDIEGSTALIHALGSSGYASALDDHRRLLRDAFARNDGYEVDTQGDAFFVAFNRVQDAISAAAEAQHELAGHAWPNGHVLRVRMGIHTTQAMLTAGSYVGVGVHRAARICAAPAATLDLGEHRLKDLTEAQHLFLADCALLDGDCSTAQERYARSLDAAWRMGDEAETCYELQGMAMSAAGLGQTKRGLRLAGAAHAHPALLGVTYSVPFWSALLERYLGPAKVELRPAAANAAWEAGQNMGFERAIDEARSFDRTRADAIGAPLP